MRSRRACVSLVSWELGVSRYVIDLRCTVDWSADDLALWCLG